jgi:hypothetical protein
LSITDLFFLPRNAICGDKRFSRISHFLKRWLHREGTLIVMEENTWGAKLKRTVGAFFKVDPRREGECKNCGACCSLPVRCLFLRNGKDGKAFCSIYYFRPPNCRKYPRTNKEWITRDVCGFHFSDEITSRGTSNVTGGYQ